MNFFQKKNKMYISLEKNDMEGEEGGMEVKKFFLTLMPLPEKEQIILDMSETVNCHFNTLSVVLSFVLEAEKNKNPISLHAEQKMLEHWKKANLTILLRNIQENT
jgi:hypothetical protein